MGKPEGRLSDKTIRSLENEMARQRLASRNKADHSRTILEASTALFIDEAIQPSETGRYLNKSIKDFRFVRTSGTIEWPSNSQVSALFRDCSGTASGRQPLSLTCPVGPRVIIEDCDIDYLEVEDSFDSQSPLISNTTIRKALIRKGPVPGNSATYYHLFHLDPDNIERTNGRVRIVYERPFECENEERGPETALATWKALSQLKSLESNGDVIDRYYQYYRSRSDLIRHILFLYNEAHHAVWKPLFGLCVFVCASAYLIWCDMKLGLDGITQDALLPPLSYVANIPRLLSDVLLRGFPPEQWSYLYEPAYWARLPLRIFILVLEGLGAYSLYSFLAGLKKRFGYRRL